MIDSGLPAVTDFQNAFQEFVMRENFPCLGARATLAQGAGVVKAFGALGTFESTEALALELENFGEVTRDEGNRFSSMIAVFPETPALTEEEFDSLLWRQLQLLGNVDKISQSDLEISSDPNDPNFAFQFGGVPYFVVGLCPSSSRLARRFTWPTLVFNPHGVFDRLREEGKYERLKSVIRDREIALQGTLNPNLADFGDVSEARQYSGLVHEPGWKCPFHKQV
jgi:FPC/CPF motif-containing protein YcgG